ncbi:Oidioi.mRNA.OKI2018_I69.PAR.g11358.t1.cds [Oikopleura dioica]|uniref:BLOC-1-related complex subunit 5 n=1 Tax=Oikopleura dioica TaxID=34765 RepID=A0ABN7S215_OIKDI|nr:Oidioi.mRNA.OKI2018_I69.PAR.g11358.t1.cds [Oikopleura dioica]
MDEIRIVARPRTESSRSSKSDLREIPIAKPLLGDTQGQVTTFRKQINKLNPENLTTICSEISVFLEKSAADIAVKQTGIQNQLIQIDQGLAKVDERIEKQNLSKYCSEMSKLETMQSRTEKLSKNLHDLARSINNINMKLPEDKRLPPLKF